MENIHADIKEKLRKFIQLKRIPNMIFYGENGGGKKTILKDFLDNIYNGISNYKQYIMGC